MTPQEFETRITVLRPMLARIAQSMMGNSLDAEDAVQDALLRLWVVRERIFPPYESIATCIVRNCCIDFIRSQNGRERTHFEEPLPEMDTKTWNHMEPSHQTTPQTVLEEKENHEWLWRRIEQMPEAQRRICHMRYDDGLEADEIARIVGIQPHSVRSILCAARQQIIQSLLKQK